MIIKCQQDMLNKFKKNHLYLCVEMETTIQPYSVYYRVVDEEGCIEQYPSHLFEIEAEKSLGMAYIRTENKIILQLKKITELEKLKSYKRGIWWAYFKGRNKELVESIHHIIVEQANIEGISIEVPFHSLDSLTRLNRWIKRFMNKEGIQ